VAQAGFSIAKVLNSDDVSTTRYTRAYLCAAGHHSSIGSKKIAGLTNGQGVENTFSQESTVKTLRLIGAVCITLSWILFVCARACQHRPTSSIRTSAARPTRPVPGSSRGSQQRTSAQFKLLLSAKQAAARSVVLALLSTAYTLRAPALQPEETKTILKLADRHTVRLSASPLI
jgi:hypothetical protein